MKTAIRASGASHRMSAEDRREQVLKAAMAEFAIHGLDGTSTEAIAERAGISQPYIFRLWPNKKDLFLATVDACFESVEPAAHPGVGTEWGARPRIERVLRPRHAAQRGGLHAPAGDR